MKSIAKAQTGINGLDEITFGGLPKGRPTLVCGGPGCGKTLLAMEFIVKGVTLFNEPGVFMSFEEKGSELADNASSLGFELEKLQKEKGQNTSENPSFEEPSYGDEFKPSVGITYGMLWMCTLYFVVLLCGSCCICGQCLYV